MKHSSPLLLLETFALGPTSYHVWLDFCYLIFAFNFMNQVFQMPIKRRKNSSALLNSNKFIWHFKSMRCCNLHHVVNNQHIFAIFPLYLSFVQPSIDHVWIQFLLCHFCTLGMEGFYVENLEKKNPQFIWNFWCQLDQNVLAPTIKNQLLFVLEL